MFQNGLSGGITLGSTLSLNKDVIITGPGASILAISGNDLIRVFEVNPGVSATISALAITGGSAPEGAGIKNGGTLTVIDSTFDLNLLYHRSYGGAIYNSGTLTITNSVFDSNQMKFPQLSVYGFGAAIYNGGVLTINGSTFSNNLSISTRDIEDGAGGAIYNDNGAELHLNNSSFTSNKSGYGGAIYNLGLLSVGGCSFSGNESDNRVNSAGGIVSTGTLTVTGSTFTGNNGLNGGAIYNVAGGDASIITCTFTDNWGSTNPGRGGGIGNYGKMTISDSSFSGNWSQVGGGIRNAGELSITDSSFSDNYSLSDGGGILNEGTLTASHVIFSGNSARTGNGGAISSQQSFSSNNRSVATIANGSFTNNSAPGVGGGIHNGAGDLTVDSCTFNGNSATDGGGIASELRPLVVGNTTLTVTTSTFSNNSATRGGGLWSFTSADNVINSTFSGNVAKEIYLGGGGAIYSQQDILMAVTNCTVTSNNSGAPGGGLYNSNYSPGRGPVVVLNNTIVAGNTASGGSGSEFGGASVTGSNNLIGDANSSGGFVNGSNGNIVGVSDLSAVLAWSASTGKPALADNGGPTRTIALVPGGAAIDAGSNALAVDSQGQPLTTDQRGSGYDRIINGIVDIGAYEYSYAPSPTPAPPPTTTPQPTATRTSTATTAPSRTATLSRTPTNTSTATVPPRNTPTSTATTTNTRTATPTSVPTPIPTSTFTATSTVTPRSTPTSTATATGTRTPTPTSAPAPEVCTGDCNGDGQVTVDEILTMANMALGRPVAIWCAAGDPNGDGRCTLDEIIAAVNNALGGCPGVGPTPAPTPTLAAGCHSDADCPPNSPSCGPDGRCWAQPCSTLCGSTCCGPGQECQGDETCSPAQAGLIHEYELNGTFADSFGGPPIVPNGGTLGPAGYTFGPDQGPTLSNAIPASNYSIEMRFVIDNTSGYRKLIDFKDRTKDRGLYNLNGALVFYGHTDGPGGAFTPGVPVSLLVTRNGNTGEFVASINGVQQISFVDSTNDATFTAANNVAHLFRDDTVTAGRENPSGFLDFVRIYDAPITTSGPALTATPTRR